MASTISQDALNRLVDDGLRKSLSLSPDQVLHPSDTLGSLGASSLQYYEIIVWLEQKMGELLESHWTTIKLRREDASGAHVQCPKDYSRRLMRAFGTFLGVEKLEKIADLSGESEADEANSITIEGLQCMVCSAVERLRVQSKD